MYIENFYTRIIISIAHVSGAAIPMAKLMMNNKYEQFLPVLNVEIAALYYKNHTRICLTKCNIFIRQN